MSKVVMVALARPTFDLGCAQANFDAARALLTDLGAEVVGFRVLPARTPNPEVRHLFSR